MPALPTFTSTFKQNVSGARMLKMISVDARGHVTELEMPITRLKDETRLHMRELLLIEQPLSLSQPRILPRRHCVPFTVGHVRGIVFVDRVLLFTGGDHRSSINPFAYAASLAKHIRMVFMLPELQPPPTVAPEPAEDPVVDDDPYFGEGMIAEPQASLLPEDAVAAETWAPPADQPARAAEEQTPFEFVVLEHVLLTMTARQHKRVVYAGRVLEATLAKMGTVERDDSRLYALFPLGNTLSHYELVSRGLMECVRALLEDPRDMREACLTDKARKAGELRHKAHRRAEEMAASYDPDIGKGGGAPHALAGGASVHFNNGGDSGGPSLVVGRHAHRLHSDSHDAAANQLHDSHNLSHGSTALEQQLSGATPEGADAYTGHSASPIASHQHLRSVLESAAAAPQPVLVYRFTPPATAQGAGHRSGSSRHIVGPPAPSGAEADEDSDSDSDAAGEEGGEAAHGGAPAGAASSSSAAQALAAAPVPPPGRAPARRPAGESRSHEGDDDEATGRKRGSAASRSGGSAAGHVHQAKPHTEHLGGGAAGSGAGHHHHHQQQQQHATWVGTGDPEAEHPDDAYSAFQHSDAHALGRHEHNHSGPHAYSPSPASSTLRGIYDHVLEAADGAGHAARLLHATPHPPSRSGGAEGAFPEILRISPDTLSQLELMLESVYHRAAASTIAAVELSRSLGNKQDLLDLQTSNYRNYLLSVSLRMSMISVAVAFATFFSSAFGMNLTSGLEQLPFAFVGVSAISAASGAYLYRLIDRLTVRNSPTKRHARRLETLQSFLYRLDSNLDAAKETLEAVTNEGARAGRAAGRRPPSPVPGAATPLLSNAGAAQPRAPVAGRMARLLSNEFGEDGASHAPAPSAGPVSLSRDEFKAVHRRTTGRDISDDEVDLLFDLLDVDGDGRLRLEEVLGLYQRTGSDGTGMGGY